MHEHAPILRNLYENRMTQNGATFCRTIGKCHHFNLLNNLNQHKFRAHFMFGLRTQCGIYGKVSIISTVHMAKLVSSVKCCVLVKWMRRSISRVPSIHLSIEVQQHKEQNKKNTPEKLAGNNTICCEKCQYTKKCVLSCKGRMKGKKHSAHSHTNTSIEK